MMPTFVSDQPQLVAWAEQLWPAAEACVGWSPATPPEVLLTVGDPGTDRPGIAHRTSRGGLNKVILRAPDDLTTLAHELGHAWSHSGAPALAEGRADLVATCALQATRLGPPRQRPVELSAMEDLTAWTNTAGPKTDARSAGYASAQQLALILANVLTPEELWPVDGTLDWTELDAILEGHGKPGQRVYQAIHGGIETQRAAFLDDDADGLSNLAESLGGTRPDRWDTDGDGRWDGAPDPLTGARAIPLDGRDHCLGVVGSGDVVVTWHGPDRVTLRINDTEVPVDVATTVTVAGPVVARSRQPGAGGAWVLVEGATPSTEGCVERAGFTLRVAPGATADLVALEKRIRSVQKAVSRRGFVVHPFSLDLLPGGKVSVSGRRLGLSAERAAEPGGIELVVASAVLGDLGTSALGARLALATELGAPDAFVDRWKREAEIAAWTEARAKCVTGWAGLLDGSCPHPP